MINNVKSRGKMRIRNLILMVVVLLIGCEETDIPTEASDDVRLLLSAMQISGEPYQQVEITGELRGDIEGLLLQVPEFVLYQVPGRTIIRYAMPNESRIAKRYYKDTVNCVRGEYEFWMVLQGQNCGDIISNKISVEIE